MNLVLRSLSTQIEVLTIKKSSVLWNIRQCSSLEVNRRSGGHCRLYLQSRSISKSRNHEVGSKQSPVLAWHIIRPRLWRRNVPPKRRLTFYGLHDIISHYTYTAVRTSNPTYVRLRWPLRFHIVAIDGNERMEMGHTYLPTYLSMALQSFLLDLGCFFSFLIFYTVGRTPWTGDQPVARPLPTHRTTQTQNKCTQTSMFEWDSNPRSQLSSERRQFMP
jgi:hypothetical protein